MEICDGCGSHIKLGEIRHIVHMTISADDGAQMTTNVTDEEMEEIIARFEAELPENLERQIYSERSFILCGRCKHKFMQNPLGKNRTDPFDEDSRPGLLH